MAKMSLLWPDTINDQRTIWTRSLGPCQCLATFDMATGDRSMIHLPAGTTTELLNDMIAGMAAGTVDIVIFIVNGDVGSQDHFENTEVPKFKKDIIDGLKRANKEHVVPRLRWITLWTDRVEDERRGTVPGTFVLEPNGRYGRGKPN